MTPTLTVQDLRAWALHTGVSKRRGDSVFHPALQTIISHRYKREGEFNVWFSDDSVRRFAPGPNGRLAARTYHPDTEYACEARRRRLEAG